MLPLLPSRLVQFPVVMCLGGQGDGDEGRRGRQRWSCDYCAEAPAALHSRADVTRLCVAYDRHVHAANALRITTCAALRGAPGRRTRGGQGRRADVPMHGLRRWVRGYVPGARGWFLGLGDGEGIGRGAVERARRGTAWSYPCSERGTTRTDGVRRRAWRGMRDFPSCFGERSVQIARVFRSHMYTAASTCPWLLRNRMCRAHADFRRWCWAEKNRIGLRWNELI
jgi:hypothetical protein